jgi:Ca2+-binding RTX toxin-like protein
MQMTESTQPYDHMGPLETSVSLGTAQEEPAPRSARILSVPIATLSPTFPSISEGNSGTKLMTMTVSLSAAASSTVTVGYATTSGSATPGVDYTETSGTLSFAPGETTKTFSIPILGDTNFEGDESIFIDLTSASGAVLGTNGTAGAIAKIVNDDAAPLPIATLSPIFPSVSEGNSGTKLITMTVSLSAAASSTVTVAYATTAGSATPGVDYTQTSGTLSFAPGETTKTFSIPILGDTTFEGDESIFIDLTSASGAVLGTNGTAGAIAKIVNDDTEPLPIATLSPMFPSISEGNSGTKLITMTVILSAAASSTVTVGYATTSGSATPGVDYTQTSGSLSFAPGETTKTFSIPILGDTTFEGDESIFIDLTSASGAVLGTNGTTGAIAKIVNDDTPALSLNLKGTPESNLLQGDTGNDTLDGDAGSDSLAGGTGDDTYYADTQSDLVFEAAGQGTDTVISSASFYLYAHVENLTLTGSAAFGVGNELDNLLTGNDQENLLIGWDGNDTLSGGAARDALFGVNGNDILRGDAGIDYIVAGLGNDSVYGGADADEAYGQEGDDLIFGGDDFATDILVGGEGNDTLDGGPAWDLMYGGPGNDTYYVSQQVDWTFEQPGEGADTVIADSPNGYYLYDNVENLTLVGTTPFGVGNALANLILGNSTGNVLLGGAGNDTLDGGAGLDILWGQDGADTFRISKGTGVDIIADFQVGTDKLGLTSDIGVSTFADLKSRMFQVGSDIALYLPNGDQVILLGVSTSSITESDIVFGSGPGG